MIRFMHAIVALVIWCTVAVAEQPEPLSQFLHSLTLSLPDVEKSKFGLSFKATGIVCSELSIERMKSQLLPSAVAPAFDFKLQGLGIRCKGHWSLPIGSGDFSADVLPDASASIRVALPKDAHSVPQRVELTNCQASLQFSINLGKNLGEKILNWLLGLLSSKIQGDVQEKLCADLKEKAEVNGTSAIQSLNKYMVPNYDVSEPNAKMMLSRRLRAGQEENGALDWSKVKSLQLFSKTMKDLVLPSDLNQLFKWATKRTGHFSLNGSSTPLTNVSISLSGSNLTISAGLDEVSLDGIDSVQSFEPIASVSSSDLAGSLALGTSERPNISLSSKLWIRIQSSTPDSNTVNELLENAHFKLGLEKPAINGRLKVLLKEDSFKKSTTFGQWLFGAKGCMQDLLLASPALQSFNVGFTNVSEPLTFIAEVEGKLEQDTTVLINNMVEFFNSMYLPFLPGAVYRYAQSQEFLDIANKQLAEIVPPTSSACIDPSAAQAEAAKSLPKIADWRSIFGGEIRQYIDNAADGFIADNNTRVDKKRFPSMHVKTNEADMMVTPSSVQLTGLVAIEKLRLLLPDADDEQLLYNELAIACPDGKKTLLPAFDTEARIVEQSQSYHDSIWAHADFPCGNFKQSIRAALDLYKLLALPASVATAPCIPSSFSDLKIESMTNSMHYFGHMMMKIGSGPSAEVVKDLCSSYPRLCARVSSLIKKYDQLDEINGGLAKLLKASTSLPQCSSLESPEASSTMLSTTSEDSADLTASPMLWSASFVCAALLMMLATAHISRCSAAVGRTPADSQIFGQCSMAVASWSSAKGDTAKYVRACAPTLLFVLAFALRTVSIFFLNVGHSYAIVKHADFGPLLNIDLITFSFFGMVEHYWQAGAQLMSVLLLLNSFIVAYGVILMGFFIWMVPKMQQHHSLLIRATIFLSRFPLVDVCFFSLVITTLKSSIAMPLGVDNDLLCEAGTAIYVGVASSLCGMLGAQLLRLEHKWDREVESSSRPKTAFGLRVGVGLAIYAGLILCLSADLLDVGYGGLAGDVLDEVSFSLASLLRKTITTDVVLGLILVLMVIVAPLLQATALFLAAFQRKLQALLEPARWLLEMSSAFSLMDVFLASLVTSLQINLVATWIIDNKFGDLCEQLSKYGDVECIEVSPVLAVAGFLGVFIAMACSVFVSIYWGYVETKAGYRFAAKNPDLNRRLPAMDQDNAPPPSSESVAPSVNPVPINNGPRINSFESIDLA